MTPECFCGRPVADNARACQSCTDKLERALGDVPALAEQLTLTIARQTRLTSGTFTGRLRARLEENDPQYQQLLKERRECQVATAFSAKQQALPYDPDASEAETVLRSTLVAWVRIVVEERGLRQPDNTLPGMSVTLLGSLTWLRHHPAAEKAFDELQHAIRHSWHVVDRRPDKVYAGPCDPTGEHHSTAEWAEQNMAGPCRTDLYASPGKAEVTCPRCTLVWNVEGRREYLLEAVQDQLVTAADMSRFLTVYGEPVKSDRIRKWAERGQLAAHGQTKRQQPLYRVGDVVELLATMERKCA